MARRLECQELFPGCDFVAEGQTDEELLERAASHAAEAHGVIELTEDIVTKVRACIRDRA